VRGANQDGARQLQGDFQNMKALRLALPLVMLLLVSGCASEPPPPPEELLVGQVQYVATAHEAKRGFYYTAKYNETIYGVIPASSNVPAATALMKDCGYDGNPETRFALVRFYYFWLDASRSIHSFAPWTMIAAGVPVERGNIVEVDVRSGASKSRCAVVTKVRAADLDAAECEYRDNKINWISKELNRFSPAGGPGAASVYCPFLEAEGWRQKPIGPFAGSSDGGYAWAKTP
jgi:hypothetical protein